MAASPVSYGSGEGMPRAAAVTLSLQRARQWVSHIGWHLLCLPVALSCLFPLIWMVSSSLKTQHTVFTDYRLLPQPPHVENYLRAWTQGHFGIYFLN